MASTVTPYRQGDQVRGSITGANTHTRQGPPTPGMDRGVSELSTDTAFTVQHAVPRRSLLHSETVGHQDEHELVSGHQCSTSVRVRALITRLISWRAAR
jgi:hypothetical protein